MTAGHGPERFRAPSARRRAPGCSHSAGADACRGEAGVRITSFVRGALGALALSLPLAAQSGGAATPLVNLIAEAERANPSLAAARQGWKAARQVPSQVSTLPDPQVTLQQFSVGNPLPFAGYTTSNFAYVGVGVSQDLPFPGKLRLRREIAQQEAAVAGEQAEATRRAVIEQLKEAYFRLAASDETLDILRRDGELSRQLEQVSEARYRVGQGNQQDVLKAQLEETALLREVALEQQRRDTLQARLRQILNRSPQSPPIVPAPLTETKLPYSADQLRARVAKDNPDLAAEEARVHGEEFAVQLAHKDFDPDFNVQYMYQRTGPRFPDYYMLTVGVKIPLHRRGRQKPELAEAIARRGAAQRQFEAGTQTAYFAVQDQVLAARTGAQVLKIYRQGLIPQATATFNAGMAAYQQGREDFETLEQSFRDVLTLDRQYWSTLAAHEIALAKIEELTGVSLP